MKKNGFIATSLIYSFFLIFITLFLTIIADYLQNKVLLNTIEKGIKYDLNSTMNINDFEIGDLISFVDDCTTFEENYDFKPEDSYVIANINYSDKKLILYSYFLCDNYNESCSDGLTDFFDIPSSNQNATYYNKIIYNFDKSQSKSFSVDDGTYSVDNGRECISGDGDKYNTGSGCLSSYVSDYVRIRKVEEISNRLSKCKSPNNDAMGVIYIQR